MGTDTSVHVLHAGEDTPVAWSRARSELVYDDVLWDFDRELLHGDNIVHVLDGPIPAVVSVATVRNDNPDIKWGYSDERVFERPIPVRDLELVHRTTVPESDTTLSADDGARLLRALYDFDRAPLPWYVQDTSHCSSPEIVRNSHINRHCTACDSHAESVPTQPHALDDGPFPTVVSVCANCHDLLHRAVGPSFEDLLYGRRPACPACGAHNARRIIYGMPALPIPPGYGTAGCVIDPRDDMHPFTCGECGHGFDDPARSESSPTV